MKLVDISALVALSFHPAGETSINDTSLKTWLTARAVGYDNILLSAGQRRRMEPCRKLCRDKCALCCGCQKHQG